MQCSRLDTLHGISGVQGGRAVLPGQCPWREGSARNRSCLLPRDVRVLDVGASPPGACGPAQVRAPGGVGGCPGRQGARGVLCPPASRAGGRLAEGRGWWLLSGSRHPDSALGLKRQQQALGEAASADVGVVERSQQSARRRSFPRSPAGRRTQFLALRQGFPGDQLRSRPTRKKDRGDPVTGFEDEPTPATADLLARGGEPQGLRFSPGPFPGPPRGWTASAWSELWPAAPPDGSVGFPPGIAGISGCRAAATWPQQPWASSRKAAGPGIGTSTVPIRAVQSPQAVRGTEAGGCPCSSDVP